jgi:thiol-disulfide isomerase/thioredoxin
VATRLVAALVLFGAIGAIAFVALQSDDSDVESVAAAATTEASSTAAAVADDSSATSAAPTTTTPAIDPPENYGPRRDLVNLDGWLNTDITSLDDLDGQVVMVEMWTFGCHNCKARIPHTQDLYATYADAGFEIVGVHAPEFSYEAEIPNIEKAVVDLGVTWPVALDTEKTNFRAWQDGGRRFWPRTYVIDQNGDVRYDHIGEGRYDELEATVAWLLDNPPT